MKLIQVGSEECMRKTIPSSEYPSWLESNTMSDAHRSNYQFDSPYGIVLAKYAIVRHVLIDVDDNTGRPDKVLNDYFDGLDIKRTFISSGRHFHLLIAVDRLPAEYASASISSFISVIQMELGIVFDPISSDLMHLRRAVGSINPKSGRMTCFYDPDTFKTSLEPIILGSVNKELPVVMVKNYPQWGIIKKKKVMAFQKMLGDVDPFSLSIRLPDDMGHYSRIGVLRNLRNCGVKKERALEYMKSWLTEGKYSHMMGEGVVQRIWDRKL